MTRILAIDPGSTSLGIYDGAHSRTVLMSGKLDRPVRLAGMACVLKNLLGEGGYDFVIYEEQFVRGGGATKALFGVVGIIEAMAINSGAGVMSIPQSALRAWALTKTGQKPRRLNREDAKAVMKAAALACDPNLDLKSEHEYDAAALYHYVKEEGIVG